jgi:hypothetical protein
MVWSCKTVEMETDQAFVAGESQWARLRASAKALHGGAVVPTRQRSSGLSGQCDDGRFTRGSGHRIAGAMGVDAQRMEGQESPGRGG